MTTNAVERWTFGRAIDEPDTYLIGSGGVFWCRVVGGPHGPAEARARVMHAAPELLAACEDIYSQISRGSVMDGCYPIKPVTINALVDAIAEAGGSLER
jgi:hypothetical protein